MVFLLKRTMYKVPILVFKEKCIDLESYIVYISKCIIIIPKYSSFIIYFFYIFMKQSF